MVTLTEDMVIARSKGSDLHNIRKLNCWGSELADVSVVRKLPNVEVLSLSVNRIATLADFQACHNLQELYIRKNNISDINEVLYLRELPKLRSLWLADNPCAEFEQYRYTVLRALPHLQKLDNVPIEPEEVQRAMVCGMALPFSNSPSKFRANEETELPRSNSAGDSLRSSGGGSSISDSTPSSPERRYSHSTSPLRLSHQDMSEYSRSSNDGYVYEDERPVSQQQQRRNSSSQQSRQQLQQQHSQQQQDSDYNDRRISQASAYSNSQYSVEDRSYSESNGYSQVPSSEVRHSPVGNDYRSPTNHESDMVGLVQQHYNGTYRRVEQQMEAAAHYAAVERPSPTKPYPVRPKTRNANVLSAILCLIKELDYSSLEVVEMAVRCRMAEVEE